jgi:predicted DNA-binding protein
MARNPNRRSISISLGTYLKIKAYSETNNQSMASFVTELATTFLDNNEDFFVPVRDPLPEPPKVVLPVESAEEFSKRFAKLSAKDPYHVEVSRKSPEEMEKADLIRIQIEADRKKREESIRLAAERKVKLEAERDLATGGGIFTF